MKTIFFTIAILFSFAYRNIYY